MTWHVDEMTIERYVHDRIDETAAFSVEAHVLGCTTCRASLVSHVEPERRERIWSDLRAEVDRPRVTLAERALVRLGVREHVAKLLATAPALRRSWLVAVLATLVFAVAASRLGDGDLPFLVVAPLIPVLGVALAFGWPADPVWELAVASPTGGPRLILLRAATVLATSIALSGAAGLLLPDVGWGSAAWLLPSLALTLLTLLVSSVTASTATAAGAVATGWIVGVVALERLAAEPLAAFGEFGQIASVLVAVASALLLSGRRDAIDHRTRA